MNDRHRRIERLKQQQNKDLAIQYGLTPEQLTKIYKNVSLALSNIAIGVGTVFVDVGETIISAGETMKLDAE